MTATLLFTAAAAQMLLALSNAGVRRMLPFHRDLARVSPIVRQICTVHHHYIAAILAGFALLTALFPRELVSAAPLPRALCAGIALFWGVRLSLQLLYYDRAVRRRHRGWDLLFTATFAGLTSVYALAALGILR